MRTVASVITASRVKEGAGFYVRRPFPTRELDRIDPFLLLDHMEPNDLGPGEAEGAPDHPHRGFETVTYMLEGTMVHKDSAGNKGRISSGDVQWMTAGSGVIHSEMPSEEIQRKGGRLNGLQLWVNLPQRDKMMAPRYQDTLAESIPVADSPDKSVKVKVIAGESLGQSAVIQTRTPIIYLHVKMMADAAFEQPIPASFNAFIFVLSGQVTSGGQTASSDQLMLFNQDGDKVSVSTASTGADFLLVAGEPLNEPVSRYGPFVMNTKSEIMQAIDDFNEGKFGQI